jgi:hypothetical protein
VRWSGAHLFPPSPSCSGLTDGTVCCLEDRSPAQSTSELRSDRYRRSSETRNGMTSTAKKNKQATEGPKLVGGVSRLYVGDLPQRKHV